MSATTATVSVLDNLHEFDEVVITGTASSPAGRRCEGLRATVAAVLRLGEPALAVWPEGESNRVWFPEDQIESLAVVG